MVELLPNPTHLWDGSSWHFVSFEMRESRIVFKMRFNRELQDELKASCHARWNFFKEKEWSVPFNARSLFNIHYLANTELRDRYFSEVSPTPPNRDCLKQHQRDLLSFALHKKTVYGAYEMGLGKTLVSIEFMEKIRAQADQMVAPKEQFWVILPKRLIRTWERELEKWDADFTPQLIVNSYESIKKAMDRAIFPPTCLIIDEIGNFRNKSKRTRLVQDLTNRMQLFTSWESYVLGLSGTPSPKNKGDWWNQLEIICPGAIREASWKKFVNRIAVYESTENSTGGVYPKFITWRDGVCAECGLHRSEHENQGKKLAPFNEDGSINNEYWTSARKSCMYFPKILCKICGKLHKKHYDCGNYEPECIERDELSLLPKRLAPYVLVRKKAECADLPDKLYKTIESEPTQDMIRAAELIMDQCATKLELMQRLRQFSDGFQYLPEWEESETAVNIAGSAKQAQVFSPCPKLESYKDFLDQLIELDQYRFVVYAAYKASIDQLITASLRKGWQVMALDSRGLRGYGTPSDAELGEAYFHDARADQPVAFIGHAQSMGFGLNLQVSKYVGFYSNSYKADHRSQGIDRVHRLGMTGEPVTVIDFVCLGIDRLVVDNVKNKIDAEQLTLDQIRGNLL